LFQLRKHIIINIRKSSGKTGEGSLITGRIYMGVHAFTESEDKEMRKKDLYWKKNSDWWYIKDMEFYMKEDAPQEAKESYERYQKQREKMEREEDSRLSASEAFDENED